MAKKPSAKELMNIEVRAGLAGWEERYSLDYKSASMALDGRKSADWYAARRENPGIITLDQLRYLAERCKWSDEQILRMVRPE